MNSSHSSIFRRVLLLLVAVGWCALATPARSSAGEERSKDPRPNIIIIVADDLGYADVGIQGCKDIPTPNIDSIARNGIRFTAGYVQPWCAPTRHSLITACWPGKNAWELYEIEKDISETRDVAAEHPMVVRELTAALERWQKTGRP